MYWCFLYVVCKPRLGSVCSYFYTDTAVFERLRLNFVSGKGKSIKKSIKYWEPRLNENRYFFEDELTHVEVGKAGQPGHAHRGPPEVIG